jgi:hypothetical protein
MRKHPMCSPAAPRYHTSFQEPIKTACSCRKEQLTKALLLVIKARALLCDPLRQQARQQLAQVNHSTAATWLQQEPCG